MTASFAADAIRIEAEVRNGPVIASDETTARVIGHTCWQWVFSSATAVSHRIAGTRARTVVKDFLQKARPQVWVSDRCGGQMGHGQLHQACLAHIFHNTQYAIDAGDTMFAPYFKFLIKRALAIARRRENIKDATLDKTNATLRAALPGCLHLNLALMPEANCGAPWKKPATCYSCS